MRMLTGKKGLVIGVANEHSIAWGCARAFAAAGADLALTYQNGKAEPYVRPLASEIAAQIVMPLDMRDDAQTEAVFSAIAARWGRLDFALHAIAFAPKDDLHGRVADASRPGFLEAMDASCYSFIRMARAAEPLMSGGGCLLTMSYYGGEKVVPHYGIMGPVKAALESTVRYLAAELGPKRIRVNALSPGPIATRAASGIVDFQALIDAAVRIAPEHATVGIDDVGAFARFLVSDEAQFVTGNVCYIDAGFHSMGAWAHGVAPPITHGPSRRH